VFAAMNADPVVMAHFPAPLTGAESDALADDIASRLAARGFGLWALEIPGVVPFAGVVGLAVPTFTASFTPCVEIGWRLAAAHWGHGYATEAARAVLAHAWAVLGLDEVVSFTTAGNTRSRAVMARLGMRYDPADDFDHPRLPPGHPLRPHVLYRIARPR
jgi:RimJ/RimL family protein N-acetyltransferase